MITPTVMNLTVLSPAFPEVEREIERPHFLDTIQHIFDAQTELIFLEGVEGIGKTVLSSQFVRRHPQNALSSFVSYTNRSTSDPEVIKDVLYEQLIWAIDCRSHSGHEFVSDAMLNIEISRLTRKAKRENTNYYFVLDGLDEFPVATEQNRLTQILSLLPFGYPNFRFLITGESSALLALIGGKTTSKPFHLSGFTLGETSKYLTSLSLSDESISELHTLAQRVPGYLASVRRSLETGTKVDEILAGTGSLPDFFDFEWSKTDPNDSVQEQILSIIAHNTKNRGAIEIGEILRLKPEIVAEKVAPLPFILESSDGTLSYVNGTFRAYAAKRLISLENQTGNLLIDHLFTTPRVLTL